MQQNQRDLYWSFCGFSDQAISNLQIAEEILNPRKEFPKIPSQSCRVSLRLSHEQIKSTNARTERKEK